MKLYIAEKPSLGRAIAEALPKPHKKHEGYIALGNGDVVSWCVGHLLEQAPPEHYSPDYKKWKSEDLPIVPQQWKLCVKEKTKKQFSTLKKLIKEAKQLVNAGDPDREGQILVDEVINYCAVPNAKRVATKRCLISDLNPEAVKRSLKQLKNNREFIPLATSALARARADWLYGINMTRLCTLRGQKDGFSGVLSIGRVQTPLLGLVVRRDNEIESFTAKPFYELEVHLTTARNFSFDAKWKPSAACDAYVDEENRVLSRPLVENVASRVVGKTGTVSDFDSRLKKQQAPLPYNLSALQIDAAKQYGLSAKKVLDICQTLYEKHKLITYPRSDCRFLPQEHYREAKRVLDAVNHNAGALHKVMASIDASIKGRVWNDKKISAHHAIVPTAKKTSAESLSTTEKNVYALISRQYLMQFLPRFEYRQVTIEASIEGGTFVAKRKEIIRLGWKIALAKSHIKEDQALNESDIDGRFVTAPTPALKQGDLLTCIDTKILDKQTTPPKRFNDASLLSAMTGISRYVKNPEIKKILRETDGLGTEATRAGIIELLFSRGFLFRQGKEIRSTDIGRELIVNLPETMTLPDMTAQWESQLEAICNKQLKYANFIEPLTCDLRTLVSKVSKSSFIALRGKGKKPFKRSTRKKRKILAPA